MINAAYGSAATLGSVGILSASVSSTLQVVSIFVGAGIVVLAGLFTIRAKNAEWWQQSYEGVKAAYDSEKKRADDLQKDNAALVARVTTLEAMPNYDIVVDMMKRSMEASEAMSGNVVTAVNAIETAVDKLADAIGRTIPKEDAP